MVGPGGPRKAPLFRAKRACTRCEIGQVEDHIFAPIDTSGPALHSLVAHTGAMRDARIAPPAIKNRKLSLMPSLKWHCIKYLLNIAAECRGFAQWGESFNHLSSRSNEGKPAADITLQAHSK